MTDLAVITIGNPATWTVLLLSWVKITPSWLLQVLSTKCVAGKDGFVSVDHAHHEDGLGAVHKVRERFFFAIIDTPFPQVITFYTYPSSLFPQYLVPALLKSADVIYGRPLAALRWEHSGNFFLFHYDRNTPRLRPGRTKVTRLHRAELFDSGDFQYVF